MPHDFSTDQLANLIRQKLRVLTQLRDASLHQAEAIEQGEMDQLFSVLNAKQSLVRGLEALENDLAPFRRQAPESRRWRTAQHRSACRQTVHQCEQLLEEILRTEQQCEAKLMEQREQTAHRLQAANSAQQACTAYARSTPTPPRRLDLYSN